MHAYAYILFFRIYSFVPTGINGHMMLWLPRRVIELLLTLSCGLLFPARCHQAYIEAENMRLENEACQFSAKEIIIRIEYKYCPNLTIIDTPGLIAPAPGKKSRTLQVSCDSRCFFFFFLPTLVVNYN